MEFMALPLKCVIGRRFFIDTINVGNIRGGFTAAPGECFKVQCTRDEVVTSYSAASVTWHIRNELQNVSISVLHN